MTEAEGRSPSVKSESKVGFKLENKVVAVPAGFVFLNGVRMSWSEFEASIRALDAPARSRPENLQDPFYNPLFESLRVFP